MTVRKYSKLTLLFFLFISIFINAQEKDSVRIYILPETVVTGTRFELKQNMLPSSISIIDNEQIAKSTETNILPLINNSVPGLFINTRTVLGYGVSAVSSGEISIRGISESPNTASLVLVNGQPQFMGIFGHPINDSYLASDIERVEIIRGPASLLYGTNAAGGAINMITRKQKNEGPSFRSTLSYGSFNTAMFSGTAGYKNKDLTLSSSYNYSGTDGHRKDGKDDFNSNSVYAVANYAAGTNYSIGIDGNYTASKFYDPGPESSPKDTNYYNYNRGRVALSFDNHFTSTEGGLKLFYNFGDHDFFDGWESTDRLLGVTVYQNFKFSGENVLTAGFEYKNYGGKAPAAVNRLGTDLNINEVEGYAVIQVNVLEKLFLNGGIRGTSNSVYGAEYTPQFGFSYIINNSLTVRGNAGKSFRSPSVADLYLFPVSNENLEPERIWSYEAGITSYLLDNQLKGDLTFFYLEADNIIQPSPLLRGKKLNSGYFVNKGIELMLSAAQGNFLRENIGYTYLHTGKILPYAPEHKLSLHVELSASIFLVSADIQGIWNLYPEGSTVQENFSTISLTTSAQLNNFLSIYVKGNNLTNEKYYIDKEYPSPGIYFLSGLKLNF